MPALFVGEALLAISESASSGAQEALLYRVCRQEKSKHRIEYKEAQPAFLSAAWAAVVVGGLLGTPIVWWSLDALGPASVMIQGLPCAVAFFLPKIPVGHRSRSGESLRMRELVTAIWQKGVFRFWFLMGAFCIFVLSVTYFTIQPLLNEFNLAGPGNGLLYSGVTAFAAYAAHITNRLNNWFSTLYQALFAPLALLTVAILTLHWADSLVVVFIAMAGLRFAWGWLGATYTTALNAVIPMDEMRATIFSVQSLLAALLSATTLAMFARIELPASSILLVLAGAVAGVGSAPFFLVLPKR